MKKDIETIITVFLLVFAGFIGFITFESEFVIAAGATIYVDDDNTGSPTMDGSMLDPYDTIQKGIDNATDGDTVFVFNGTYIENVIVNKSIDLVGDGKSNTTIDGSGAGPVISITVNNVDIQGFTIQNSGEGHAAVVLNGLKHCNVSQNIVAGNYFGIILGYSSNNRINGNTLTDNYCAILLHESDNNEFFINNITGNM